ncbi:MAG: (2Fe-2S)-binding protein [Oscillospiraceae bacterium]|jgi:NAD(P)H-nitrite reductase large subunit|nr:(2Fe-2S)-binding protein [Oscillospiraceae bacterium]
MSATDWNDRICTLGPFEPAPGDGFIVCRCVEITQGDVRRAVHDGMFTLHEVRRLLRCGMGLCQGQICGRLVRGIVAKELGVSPTALEEVTARAPMRPVEMRVFGSEEAGA